MDFEQLERIITEHGLPRNDVDIINTVQEEMSEDVSLHLLPRVQNGSGNRPRFAAFSTEGSAAVHAQYTRYRSSRRMSSARINTAYVHAGVIHVSRSTSPIGTMGNYVGTYSTRIADLLRTAGYVGDSTPLPIVLDENTRVDYSPHENQHITHDHVRVQCLIRSQTVDLGAERVIDRGTMLSPYLPRDTTPAWDPEISIDQLRANGWIPILASGYLWGAYLPEAVDPQGKHLLVLGMSKMQSHYVVNSTVIAYCMSYIMDRWNPEASVTQGPSPEAIELADALRALMRISESSNRDLAIARESLQSAMSNAEMYTTSLAESLRRVENSQQAIASLERDLPARVLEDYKRASQVAGTVQAMRPVLRSQVLNNRTLEVVTHRYGMENSRTPGNLVLLPSLRYTIEMTGSHFQRSISVTDVNGSTRRIHPHVSREGTICWGEAGRPLAEAWARKDWTSLMRLILGWHTQHNHVSPYTAWEDIVVAHGAAASRGWVIPEEVVDAAVDVDGATEANPQSASTIHAITESIGGTHASVPAFSARGLSRFEPVQVNFDNDHAMEDETVDLF